MEKVLKLHKDPGETPLECLQRFRAENPEYAGAPMTYAGRLDPMAEGLLIVLVGDECKEKEKYLGLDKEYVFEVLFGIQTDTYDVLGLPNISLIRANSGIVAKEFVGKRVQKYPPYSSKTLDGEPLFVKAKRGEEFEAPTKETEIYNLDMLEEREISAEEMLAEISRKIDLVSGDFRQKEIKDAWQEMLGPAPEQKFKIAKMKINCSSGTYVRSLCHELGGIAWSIRRTKVGDFEL